MRGGVSLARETRDLRKMRVRTSLLNQLEGSEQAEEIWRDLVFDYLVFWEIKEKLKIEIERRGPMVDIVNGSQKFRKRSDAVVELPKISKRMTDILEVLNIRPPEQEGEPDDDNDY